MSLIILNNQPGKRLFDGQMDVNQTTVMRFTKSAAISMLLDAFFASMAITIIGGFMFATMLTMIVVPVFYLILYRA